MSDIEKSIAVTLHEYLLMQAKNGKFLRLQSVMVTLHEYLLMQAHTSRRKGLHTRSNITRIPANAGGYFPAVQNSQSD